MRVSVVKRFIIVLRNGSTTVNCKLSADQIELFQTSSHLRDCRPFDVARQTRSIKHHERLKATECQQFLLYTAVTIMKDILDKRRYRNFLCLSIAMIIILNEDNALRTHCLEFAKNYWFTFF